MFPHLLDIYQMFLKARASSSVSAFGVVPRGSMNEFHRRPVPSEVGVVVVRGEVSGVKSPNNTVYF